MHPQKRERHWKRNRRQNYLFLVPLFVICLAWTLLAPHPGSAATQPPVKAGSVGGSFIVKDGGTMTGGQVLFYRADDGPPPLYAKYTRVPDQIIQIDAGNSFAAILPVGEYYLLATKRRSGEKLGPPMEGDYGFRLMDGKGEWKSFAIRVGQHLDLGTLVVKFKGKREKSAKAATAITGVIRDTEGKAVEHAVVFAFPTPQMQGNRPQFLSYRTGPDGKYILHVDGDTTYYLLARGFLGGGQVAEGEVIGTYGKPVPAGITVKSGETVKGVDIMVSMMGHRGPVVTDSSGKEPDPAKQRSKMPAWLPPTLPGSLLEDNIPEKAGGN